MPSRLKYAILSLLAGFIAFAAAGFAAGYFIGTGPKQSHALGPLLTGGIISVYTAPMGAVVGLIAALVIGERTWKKMSLVLALGFVLMALVSAAYVWRMIR